MDPPEKACDKLYTNLKSESDDGSDQNQSSSNIIEWSDFVFFVIIVNKNFLYSHFSAKSPNFLGGSKNGPGPGGLDRRVMTPY